MNRKVTFSLMGDIETPLFAAVEVAERFGIRTDRREIIQDANTLVVRLTDDLVARE